MSWYERINLWMTGQILDDEEDEQLRSRIENLKEAAGAAGDDLSGLTTDQVLSLFIIRTASSKLAI